MVGSYSKNLATLNLK